MEQEKDPVSAFVGEIASLVGEERKTRTTAYFSDPNFHAEELTIEDKEMWDRVKEGTATIEGFEEYRKKLHKSLEEQPQRHYSSREIFAEFLANRVMDIEGERELERKKKENAK